MTAGRTRYGRERPQSVWDYSNPYAFDLDILNALLERGADPTLPGHSIGRTLLMSHIMHGYNKDCIARLLEDPRVRATINVRDRMWDVTPTWAAFAQG